MHSPQRFNQNSNEKISLHVEKIVRLLVEKQSDNLLLQANPKRYSTLQKLRRFNIDLQPERPHRKTEKVF